MVTLRDRRTVRDFEQLDAYVGNSLAGTVEFRLTGETLDVLYMRGPGEAILRALTELLSPVYVAGGVRSRASYLAAERAFGPSPVVIEKAGVPVFREEALAYLPAEVTSHDGLGVDNTEEIYLKFRLR